MNLTKTRNTTKYLAIKELSDENKTYSISALCEFAGIARSAYYKWLDHVNSDNDNLNERIADTITKIHDEHPDMGYRRIRDTLAHDYKIAVNDKRVLRICRKKKIQSYIKHRYNCFCGCIHTINIFEMSGDISCRHSFCIHRKYLIFNV